MRTGRTDLPLHGGKAPRWLFQRMTRLSREIVAALVEEHGPGEVLARVSDPFWFQTFGCVLGFDWHSSGVTTTVCGALKEGLAGRERELGLWVCGGKGARSRRTPGEIARACQALGRDPAPLVYASRMSAKVDSAAVQDGYQLYAHSFLFAADGAWAVVQQGMNGETRLARRYHWLSAGVEDFVQEPHAAICSDRVGQLTLNMVAAESAGARTSSAEAARMRPAALLGEVEPYLGEHLFMPRRHDIRREDISPRNFHKVLLATYERQPAGFEQLLATPGVGARTVRALALISELVWGRPPSWRDPARFAFAHGGKDGHPFPVDRATYDRSIEILSGSLRRARLEHSDKRGAFGRLDALRRAGEAAGSAG
jgi:hypothetical protein